MKGDEFLPRIEVRKLTLRRWSLRKDHDRWGEKD
jgi:hypothetical protein